MPFKTISASVALTAVSLAYIYAAPSGISQVEAEGLTMSAFSSPCPTSTLAELLDDESRTAMQAKSTQELVLALFVYKLCTFPWLVDAAPHLIGLAQTCRLEDLAHWVIKNTFFRQFCGGETPEECVASMDRLGRAGINCILDLSVEADLHLDEIKPPKKEKTKYWRQEQNADVIVEMTKHCLNTAAEGQQHAASSACAAIKVTAFAPPELLLRLNQVVSQLGQAFQHNQVHGVLDKHGLERVIRQVLPPAESSEQQQLRDSLVAGLPRDASLDQIEFFKLFNLQGPARDIWWHTKSNNTREVLLTADELQAYDRMVRRLDEVCSLAHHRRVGIMVDAEQSYFQEAIDHVAMNLQQKFNRREDHDHTPTVYNTYQMYTKAAQSKLERDVETAKRENFAFAAKLVRGAYMVSERKRAEQMGYPSPIHDTLEDTHASYNNGVRFLLDKLSQHQQETGETLTSTTAPIVFMVASHNRESVLLTVEEMDRHNVLPRSGVVHFGQLFGMQDQISYTLGKNGYSIYKYLPYGMIDEVVPYLLRRAQENSAVLGGVTKERSLMWQELKDRLTGAAQPPVTTTTATSTAAAAAAATAGANTSPDVSITETA
ncbi:hypothetical protein DFQ28_000990 [Apophysomyces sp. BC1034]|nr:hypothetical protein DFQ30_002606 [Apophysomyces sp. BC1015]KAG0178302.1 hypothetical protein DFQ29_003654 [Apophysomyces sp. BC1021]KAG0191092.1 hypothetical protein DFQ28_000990 [Apophysomyces sp. BC1034]